jgi:hypothetical protein
LRRNDGRYRRRLSASDPMMIGSADAVHHAGGGHQRRWPPHIGVSASSRPPASRAPVVVKLAPDHPVGSPRTQ